LLRQRLAGKGPPADLSGAARRSLPEALAATLFPGPLVPAAVLIALVRADDGLSVILTRRTEDLRDHAGQISFPGGRVETGDDTPVTTALREAEEEIGLPRSAVEVLGCLDPELVVTGYAVCPVVAVVAGSVPLAASSAEVAEVFSLPLAFVQDPRNRRDAEREVRGLHLPVISYRFGRHDIWGATARMLAVLAEKSI
jgi:8-oxo-dGTP pyrophosphatase MutT (NUDIX family)